MSNKPQPITEAEAKEIAAIQAVRQSWGAETAQEMANILAADVYAVKFDFISGGPGYPGDYFLLQGDALGENPIQIARRDGKLEVI